MIKKGFLKGDKPMRKVNAQPKTVLRKQAGFTLIEMLVVVVVLGILAMIIIPQVAVSTDDANLRTLETNLSTLRNSIELYYHQHNSNYPGAAHHTTGAATASDAEAATAMVEQMTKYSRVDGVVGNTKGGLFLYGPYLKGINLPTNPYNNLNTVICDFDETDITVRSSAGTNSGWKFYPITGVLIPGDNGAHDNL
jgi:prepilin-type N-terminal cleavage/methylation domain-containing protein